MARFGKCSDCDFPDVLYIVAFYSIESIEGLTVMSNRMTTKKKINIKNAHLTKCPTVPSFIRSRLGSRFGLDELMKASGTSICRRFPRYPALLYTLPYGKSQPSCRSTVNTSIGFSTLLSTSLVHAHIAQKPPGKPPAPHHPTAVRQGLPERWTISRSGTGFRIDSVYRHPRRKRSHSGQAWWCRN